MSIVENMLGFDQEKILPYSQTKYARRNARIQEGLQRYSKEVEEKRALEASKKIIQEDINRENIAKNLVNRSTSNRHRKLLEENRMIEKITNQALSIYLTEMVINGLVFDDYFIEEKRDTLRNSIGKVFTECFNNGILTTENFKESSNIFLEEAYNNIKDCINDFVSKKDTIDIFSEDAIRNMLLEAKKADSTAKEISDSVKEKVTDTLTNEKKIAKQKAEEEKEAADSLDEDPDSSDLEDDEMEDSDEMEDDENVDEEDPSEDQEDDEEMEEKDSGEDLEGEDTDEEDSEPNHIEDAIDDQEEASEEVPQEGQEDSVGSSQGDLVITVKTNGTNVSVNANKNESVVYLNIFGKSRYKDRNRPSIFKNLLENNVYKFASVLNESSASGTDRTINMDNVLAETIVEYTILETLNTSNLIELNSNQLSSFKKMLNFNRN